MRSKFFDREIDQACRYCAIGTPNVDQDFVLCPKRGVMGGGGSLLRFSVRSAAAGDPPGPENCRRRLPAGGL